MDWLPIVAMLLEFLQDCMANRNRAEIMAGVRNPGPRETFALWYILRKECKLRGKELRDAVQEGLAYGREMPECVMNDLLDEAEAKRVAATET